MSEINRLYELRGSISGLIDVAEAKVSTLRKLLLEGETAHFRGYVVGRRSAIIDVLRDLRSLHHEVTQIIKEGENVQDQTDEIN